MNKGETVTANLIPTKGTLTALKSDVTFESACLELCDNAIDAWRRHTEGNTSMTIDLDVVENNGSTEFIVRDDAGGIPRENAAVVFGLGRTAGTEDENSIGAFGVGAKKSLVNLGVPFTIKSRTEDSEVGWQYRITEDWFDNDEDWQVNITETDEIPAGFTEIQIEDLNYSWSAETEESLRRELGRAYNFFLDDEMQGLRGTDYQLGIRVNGKPVTGLGLPDWSYSPFDGLHPRRYENIRIDLPNMPTVKLSVTVGLLRRKDSRIGGTDIYCQERNVVAHQRDIEGGFGNGPELIGLFSARHERLKVLVEIETEGDARKLPWDTQKSSIDPYNPIMRGIDGHRGVYNWLRRIVTPYYELDADKVPEAFLRAYGRKSEFAVNGGEPKKSDFRSRSRIVSHLRPDIDLPEITALRQKVRAHSILRIWDESAIDRYALPAYRLQLAREFDADLDELEFISISPPEDVIISPRDALAGIHELAKIHLDHGIRYISELREWEIPAYTEYLDYRSIGGIETTDSVPDDIPTRPEHIGDEKLPQGNGNGGYYSTRSNGHQGESKIAELYLVLKEEGKEDEPGIAQIAEIKRRKLCESLDIERASSDDEVWDALRDRVTLELLSNGSQH